MLTEVFCGRRALTACLTAPDVSSHDKVNNEPSKGPADGQNDKRHGAVPIMGRCTC
jgi:hypothetical protein